MDSPPNPDEMRAAASHASGPEQPSKMHRKIGAPPSIDELRLAAAKGTRLPSSGSGDIPDRNSPDATKEPDEGVPDRLSKRSGRWRGLWESPIGQKLKNLPKNTWETFVTREDLRANLLTSTGIAVFRAGLNWGTGGLGWAATIGAGAGFGGIRAGVNAYTKEFSQIQKQLKEQIESGSLSDEDKALAEIRLDRLENTSLRNVRARFRELSRENRVNNVTKAVVRGAVIGALGAAVGAEINELGIADFIKDRLTALSMLHDYFRGSETLFQNIIAGGSSVTGTGAGALWGLPNPTEQAKLPPEKRRRYKLTTGIKGAVIGAITGGILGEYMPAIITYAQEAFSLGKLPDAERVRNVLDEVRAAEEAAKPAVSPIATPQVEAPGPSVTPFITETPSPITIPTPAEAPRLTATPVPTEAPTLVPTASAIPIEPPAPPSPPTPAPTPTPVPAPTEAPKPQPTKDPWLGMVPNESSRMAASLDRQDNALLGDRKMQFLTVHPDHSESMFIVSHPEYPQDIENQFGVWAKHVRDSGQGADFEKLLNFKDNGYGVGNYSNAVEPLYNDSLPHPDLAPYGPDYLSLKGKIEGFYGDHLFKPMVNELKGSSLTDFMQNHHLNEKDFYNLQSALNEIKQTGEFDPFNADHLKLRELVMQEQGVSQEQYRDRVNALYVTIKRATNEAGIDPFNKSNPDYWNRTQAIIVPWKMDEWWTDLEKIK